MTPTLLAVNAGSSSLKCAAFSVVDGVPVGRGSVTVGHLASLDQQQEAFSGAIRQLNLGDVVAVGHRVVHGGTGYDSPVLLNYKVLAGLQRLVPLAPLHLPANLALIETAGRHFPDVPQIACFDTAFHRSMPEVAQRLPLPQWAWDCGIRRYGFHGLSYEHVVWKVGADALGRAVIAHLGNGSSLAAVRSGKSVDTTMGFTPTGGVMMGTRPGDLDPGVLVYLAEERAMSAEEIRQLIERESGLLGVSGTTADMQTLLKQRPNDPHANLAIALYCQTVRKHIGALAAVLGGIDTLVFTGGIGEHAEVIREEICAGLEHLGACVLVVPADEELTIARHTLEFLPRH